LLVTDDIHILTISETHLDNTFEDTVVAIHGYNIYRKDRNANEGGVAVYIQNHVPVNLGDNLMLNTVEIIWQQVPLPHIKPHFLWEAAIEHQVLTVRIWIICVKCLIIYVISTEKRIFSG
jgi:hypothetical protein